MLRKMDYDMVIEELINYFTIEKQLNLNLIYLVQQRLEILINLLKRQENLNLKFSSLLILYDAEFFAKDNKNHINAEIIANKLKVKIIDFSHYGEGDIVNKEDIITPIQNIIKFLYIVISKTNKI
jgi:hypothetical protein